MHNLQTLKKLYTPQNILSQINPTNHDNPILNRHIGKYPSTFHSTFLPFFPPQRNPPSSPNSSSISPATPRRAAQLQKCYFSLSPSADSDSATFNLLHPPLVHDIYIYTRIFMIFERTWEKGADKGKRIKEEEGVRFKSYVEDGNSRLLGTRKGKKS